MNVCIRGWVHETGHYFFHPAKEENSKRKKKAEAEGNLATTMTYIVLAAVDDLYLATLSLLLLESQMKIVKEKRKEAERNLTTTMTY